MELKQLNVKNLNKLDSTLKEVFGTSFNFGAGNAKLTKVKTVTETKIKSLRESGVEVNNKQYQKLLLILEGINTAMEKGIKDVAFDRSGYKFHGRVKALAEAAREAGLSF